MNEISETAQTRLQWVGGIAGGSLVLAILMLLCSFTSVDNYELGYSFDRYTGKIERIERQGWIVMPWWHYSVNTIDLRPQQISISANQRVLNAKLVRFDPEGLETFVEWHGRGAGDTAAEMGEILKSYAFNVNGGADCPFLSILDEMAQKTFELPGKGAGANGEAKTEPSAPSK